jgi:Leucine-rich repeat (LRR) protein
LSSTGLDADGVGALGEQLQKFSTLKHLDLSGNTGLRLLSVDILRVAARLEAFNCDKCLLVLPPQHDFSSPEQNPHRIEEMLLGRKISLNWSNLGLIPSDMIQAVALLQLCPVLKHLDLSGNAGLRLLSVDFLRIAAGLETFNCKGCHLVLPRQRDLHDVPAKNPRLIQNLLAGLYTDLIWSDLNLSPSDASQAASLLQLFPHLKRLDLSGNRGLDSSAVAIIVKALSGMALSTYVSTPKTK